MKEVEQIFIEEISDLRNWLLKNHGQKESVWLLRWKKGIQKNYITYDQIVDELISFGWVDSLPRKLDAKRTMLRISPRNPNSNWSKVNKDRVERLMGEGRMQSQGIKLVEDAKRNGRWNFLDDVELLIVPEDLELAFRNNTRAKYYYQRFPNSSKRGILEWIKNANQKNTRQRRIEETISKAAKNIKANHPKGRDAGPKVPRKH